MPSFVTELYSNGKLSIDEIQDRTRWANIFSGRTVKKIKDLNNFTGSEGVSENTALTNLLGIAPLLAHIKPDAPLPPNFNLLETLMSDGREAEAKLIAGQLHNFELSFDFVRAADGEYIILLNELTELENIQNRYVELRSNMGTLIDDMSLVFEHDDIVRDPIVQSYMMNNI